MKKMEKNVLKGIWDVIVWDYLNWFIWFRWVFKIRKMFLVIVSDKYGIGRMI